jgi:hypothetical protein
MKRMIMCFGIALTEYAVSICDLIEHEYVKMAARCRGILRNVQHGDLSRCMSVYVCGLKIQSSKK